MALNSFKNYCPSPSIIKPNLDKSTYSRKEQVNFFSHFPFHTEMVDDGVLVGLQVRVEAEEVKIIRR